MGSRRTALMLGIFCKSSKVTPDDDSNFFALSENARQLDLALKGMLSKKLRDDGPFPSNKRFKVLDLSEQYFPVSQFLENYSYIVIIDIGCHLKRSNDEEKTESLMSGIARGLKFLKEESFMEIHLDTCGFPCYVGTAAALTLPASFSSDPNVESDTKIKTFDKFRGEDVHEFDFGITVGQGQNLARELMRMATISDYVKRVKEVFENTGTRIIERNEAWMKEKKMGALLSVVKESEDSEKSVLLEIKYNTGPLSNTKPLVLVGKASLFESTFLAIRRKPEIKQYSYRTGMGGASCIIGCLYALHQLKSEASVVAILPIVENQQHEKRNKIGNIVQAMNGILIKVDNPCAEGRLIMADALSYASQLDGIAIVDVTSLTSEIDLVLGTSYIGVFTKDDKLLKQVRKACHTAGERVWKLPLFRHFTELLKIPKDPETEKVADISNVGVNDKEGMPCKAAAFLQEFVSNKRWMHMDITGVVESKGKKEYLSDWATGRSTRTLIHFCMNFSETRTTVATTVAVRKLVKKIKIKS